MFTELIVVAVPYVGQPNYYAVHLQLTQCNCIIIKLKEKKDREKNQSVI